MKSTKYVILVFLLLYLFEISYPLYINTKKSQLEYKRKKKNRNNNRIKKKQNSVSFVEQEKKKIKRRMDDDEEDDEDDEDILDNDDIELTSLVYNRCDNGHTPDDIKDCTKNQDETSSCCIFKYGTKTGCVKIGFKYLGSRSIGDMTVNCHHNFLQTFNLLLVIITLFLL